MNSNARFADEVEWNVRSAADTLVRNWALQQRGRCRGESGKGARAPGQPGDPLPNIVNAIGETQSKFGCIVFHDAASLEKEAYDQL